MCEVSKTVYQSLLETGYEPAVVSNPPIVEVWLMGAYYKHQVIENKSVEWNAHLVIKAIYDILREQVNELGKEAGRLARVSPERGCKGKRLAK